MSLSHHVNTQHGFNGQSSPTSPKLSRDFSTLRVVSADSMSAPSSPKQLQDITASPTSTVSPLEALAQLCAAEKVNDTTTETTSTMTTETTTTTTTPKQESSCGQFGIGQNDVLSGRGGLTNHHPGNVFFRQLVRIKQESYLLASKREKAGVAREIVDIIRELNPPGRFLKKDKANMWIEIGDRKAREKTSQALREGAPELREDLRNPSRVKNTAMRSVERRKSGWDKETASSFMTSTSEMTADFNRARIVSDDSVGAGYNHFLQQEQQQQQGPPPPQQPHLIESTQDFYAGSKRSRDACSAQQREGGNKRGPRLKLIKSRMEYCM